MERPRLRRKAEAVDAELVVVEEEEAVRPLRLRVP
jgi:hypothetical protein